MTLKVRVGNHVDFIGIIVTIQNCGNKGVSTWHSRRPNTLSSNGMLPVPRRKKEADYQTWKSKATQTRLASQNKLVNHNKKWIPNRDIFATWTMVCRHLNVTWNAWLDSASSSQQSAVVPNKTLLAVPSCRRALGKKTPSRPLGKIWNSNKFV